MEPFGGFLGRKKGRGPCGNTQGLRGTSFIEHIESCFEAGCFRHQMLLGGKTHSPNMEADRLGRVEEPEYDIP